MSKSKTKSRLPVCLLTKHPKRKGGDKGVWRWEVVSNFRTDSAQTELVCNRAEAVKSMRRTVMALTLWLMAEDGTEFNYAGDGEPATDAM